MIFVLSLLTILGLSGWMIFVGLFYPISVLHPWIFQLHLLVYILAFFFLLFCGLGKNTVQALRNGLAHVDRCVLFFFSWHA